jgi:hypothetical protein
MGISWDRDFIYLGGLLLGKLGGKMKFGCAYLSDSTLLSLSLLFSFIVLSLRNFAQMEVRPNGLISSLGYFYFVLIFCPYISLPSSHHLCRLDFHCPISVCLFPCLSICCLFCLSACLFACLAARNLSYLRALIFVLIFCPYNPSF